MRRRLFSLVFLSFASPALAGDLTVRVLDPQYASVPGARIQLTRGDASWTTSVVASDVGSYRFETLAPGSYLASASASGFAARVVTVRVEGEDPSAVEIRLELAAVAESVVVTGADRVQRLSDSTKT
ncbi:MAG: carboxypeptidase-like regulatory domain-containing protein, partial [Vicinamibacteria bacterium]